MNVSRILEKVGFFLNKEEGDKDKMCRIITANVIKLLDSPSRSVSELKHEMVKLQKNLPSSQEIGDYLQTWELNEALTSTHMTIDELKEEAKKPQLSKEDKAILDKEWFDCHG